MNEESANKKDRNRLEEITASLGNLPYYQADIQAGLFDMHIEALVTAITDERWDLVAEAAAYMALTAVPADDPKRLSEEAKQIAFYLSIEDPQSMTKGEILEHIRRAWPHHYETIPQSKSGLRNWWKEVGGVIDQTRRYPTAAEKRAFEKSIRDSVSAHKNSVRKFVL